MRLVRHKIANFYPILAQKLKFTIFNIFYEVNFCLKFCFCAPKTENKSKRKLSTVKSNIFCYIHIK